MGNKDPGRIAETADSAARSAGERSLKSISEYKPNEAGASNKLTVSQLRAAFALIAKWEEIPAEDLYELVIGVGLDRPVELVLATSSGATGGSWA